MFQTENIVCRVNKFPAVCGHVENSCGRQVNDYNGKQPVDSGYEGDGGQMKCPHTHSEAQTHSETLTEQFNVSSAPFKRVCYISKRTTVR